MIQVPEDRRPPLTPQLALRVTILGSFALAIFAIIFFRLWYLQVLSGDKYLAQAQGNFSRSIDVPAPRGQILDASGNKLVDSVRSIAVQISPPSLPVPIQACDNTMFVGGVWSTSCTIAHPPPADAALYNRLAGVLRMPTKREKCIVDGYVRSSLTPSYPRYLRMSAIACAVAQGYALLPYATVTVKQDLPSNSDVLYFLEEHQQQFPGLSVKPVWLRTYPLHDLAAQLFGTIGPIRPDELNDPRFKGLPQSAVVGQSGLEWTYNRYLQGIDGVDKVRVDALGHFNGYVSPGKPIAGHNLKLSLDVALQRVGQQALQQSINTNFPANAGSFVAMNPVNGEIYAMGSLPTFDPNIFTKPVPSSVYAQLNNPASNYPLIDRAIQSAGPTGSSFKPITATAALQSGRWSISSTFDDTGSFTIDGQTRKNAGGAAYGTLGLVDAIRVSDDVFFYNLGALTNSPAPQGGPLQQWARLYGIGQKTGVDIGGEIAGTLPDAAWRGRRNLLEAQCDNATGPFAYTNGTTTSAVMHPGWHRSPKRPPGGCGIADGTNRPWSIGDNISLAVGQGDVQVTPLQLATAYSAIANGGWIVRPHVGLDVQNPDGTVLQNFNPPLVRQLNINPLYLETIRQGLREAASQPGGTSADVFGNFPEQVYGKTGTAQYTGQQDYAWYACFVPPSATSKPIVVVVTVAQGGFGAVGAAPVARQILSQWFFGHKGAYVAGVSRTL